jgi:hypothetical protein
MNIQDYSNQLLSSHFVEIVKYSPEENKIQSKLHNLNRSKFKSLYFSKNNLFFGYTIRFIYFLEYTMLQKQMHPNDITFPIVSAH